MALKASRNIKIKIGVCYNGKTYMTPNGLAQAMAYEIYNKVRRGYYYRHGVSLNQRRADAMQRRAYRRIKPHCDWFYKRK